MKIKIKFSHIDLSSIATIGEKESGTLFGKLKTAAVKGAVRYTPFALESMIEKKLRNIIEENNIGITVDTVVILKNEANGSVTGIAASVSHVDHVLLFRALKKVFNENGMLASNDSLLNDISAVIGDDIEKVISAAASVLSSEKQASLAGLIVDRYNPEIRLWMNGELKKNAIDAAVSKVTVRP